MIKAIYYYKRERCEDYCASVREAAMRLFWMIDDNALNPDRIEQDERVIWQNGRTIESWNELRKLAGSPVVA